MHIHNYFNSKQILNMFSKNFNTISNFFTLKYFICIMNLPLMFLTMLIVRIPHWQFVWRSCYVCKQRLLYTTVVHIVAWLLCLTCMHVSIFSDACIEISWKQCTQRMGVKQNNSIHWPNSTVTRMYGVANW